MRLGQLWHQSSVSNTSWNNTTWQFVILLIPCRQLISSDVTICCCNDINDVITNRPPAESWRHNDVTKWRPRDGQCFPDWWTLTWGTALSTGVISRLVNCGQWREKLSQVAASWWTAELMTLLVIVYQLAYRIICPNYQPCTNKKTSKLPPLSDHQTVDSVTSRTWRRQVAGVVPQV